MMLEGKTVIITGGAQGLGRGIVQVCHREGASIVIADLREDLAVRVANSLGSRALAIGCDVRKEQDLAALLARTVEHFGHVDGLVNNAGINFVKPFLDVSAGEWDNVIQTDLRAAFLLTQLVCRQMLIRTPTRGCIVNISSVHSYAAMPGAGPYDAAKCGIVGMTKSIAVELAPRNIRVNCISPGLINTEIWQDILAASPDRTACEAYWKQNIPLGRVIEPEEIGELTSFLLSDRSSCITGSNIFADAGMTSQLVSREPW
jgi:NAD(P)-dependent dehydrogenase (short-subunit alcohol dehydrogenase family)